MDESYAARLTAATRGAQVGGTDDGATVLMTDRRAPMTDRPRSPVPIVAAALFVLAACEPHGPEPAPTTRDALAADSMTVYPHFTRGEEPSPVPRAVRIDAQIHPAESAFRELLRGPSEEERQHGFTSFFSAETAGMLRDLHFDGGRLHLDFFDFRATIPNASTSAGSRAFLGELNATAFQFAEVRELEYAIEGNCEIFWNFLQRDCEIVGRDWQF
jgi:hypothetical protein